MNNVVLIGRLTRDPDLRYLPQTNTATCTFSIAVDKGLSKEKKQEYEQKGWATADFINIVVWGRMAEVVNNYVGKGNLIAINGRISTRNYEDKQGQKRTWTEVVASSVDFIEWKDRNQNQGFGGNQNSGFGGSDNAPSGGNGFGDDYGDFNGFQPREDDNIPF